VESARLLLLSKSPAWPDGLANGSGLVGRNLQFHIASGGYGRFTRAGGLAAHPARTFANVSVLDYYALPPDVATFAKGAALGFDRPHASTVAAARSVAREGPHGLTWGTPLKRRLIEHFTNTLELEFETYQDFIPNDRTYVTLDGDVTDRHGLPVARMDVGDVPHHRIAGEWLRERGLEILDAMGANEIRPRAAGALNHVMLQGTCRAGRDPARSVLNEFCQSHEVPNLFVVDGSFMPTCGGAPTTLTIIANSLRTADYILESARTGQTARLN
jgi:choline dehydrogenase-like flavoprotein